MSNDEAYQFLQRLKSFGNDCMTEEDCESDAKDIAELVNNAVKAEREANERPQSYLVEKMCHDRSVSKKEGGEIKCQKRKL